MSNRYQEAYQDVVGLVGEQATRERLRGVSEERIAENVEIRFTGWIQEALFTLETIEQEEQYYA